MPTKRAAGDSPGRAVPMEEMLLRGEVARLQQLLRKTTEALELARQFVNGDSPQYGVFAAIDAALAKARGQDAG